MHFNVKCDCLLFSVNVKLVFDFFVTREKAYYLCMKVIGKGVRGR